MAIIPQRTFYFKILEKVHLTDIHLSLSKIQLAFKTNFKMFFYGPTQEVNSTFKNYNGRLKLKQNVKKYQKSVI